jgi:hypothetical protein
MKTLVYCAVDPRSVPLKKGEESYYHRKYEADGSFLPFSAHEFTQIGDYGTAPIAFDGSGVPTFQIPIAFKTDKFKLTLLGSRIEKCQTLISGFNIKNSEINNLRNKFKSQMLTIPAQYIDRQVFGQFPSQQGLQCSITLPVSNCTNLIFTFPRTQNQLTVSKNPLQQEIQLSYADTKIPDQPFSTTSAMHAEMMLMNAWLDSLFQASDSFINSLYNHEVTHGELDYPKTDATDYMFNCALERYGGGVFLDGKDTNGGNKTLTLRSINQYSGPLNVYLHPPDESQNIYPPNILIQEDCFWVASIDENDRPHVKFVRGYEVNELIKSIGIVE